MSDLTLNGGRARVTSSRLHGEEREDVYGMEWMEEEILNEVVGVG